MTQARKEALTDLLAKVEAGERPRQDGTLYKLFGDNWVYCWDVMYGESLDAAKALQRAVLPRHYAQVHMWPVPEMCRVDIGGGHTGRDDEPARAWLVAILKALIAQEPDQ